MALGAQKLIPLSVGATESANAISNFDVKNLFKGMLDERAMRGGPTNLAGLDYNSLAVKLNGAMGVLQDSLAENIAIQNQIKGELEGRRVGGRDALVRMKPLLERFEGIPTTKEALAQQYVKRGVEGITVEESDTPGIDLVIKFN